MRAVAKRAAMAKVAELAAAAHEASAKAARSGLAQDHADAAKMHAEVGKTMSRLGDKAGASLHAALAEHHAAAGGAPAPAKAGSSPARAAAAAPAAPASNVPASPPATPTSGRATAPSSGPATDKELGESIHAAIARIPDHEKFGYEGDKRAFISDVYSHMTDGERARFGGSLEKFQAALPRLNAGQHIDLKRADAQGDIDAEHPGKLDKSEISSMGAMYHFVRDRGAARRR